MKIRIIFIIIFFGLIFSILYHFFISHFLDLNYYPYNTFFYNPADRFFDFLANLFVPFQKEVSPYKAIDSVYFPGVYIFLLPFKFFDSFVALSIYLFLFVFLTAAVVILYLQSLELKKRLVGVVAILLSYPVLFTLDRGNIEGLVFIMLALACYGKIYKKNEFLNLVFIALTSSAKLYPLFYLLPYWIEKKYKDIFITLGLTSLFMWIGLSILGGNYQDHLNLFIRNLGIFHHEYMIDFEGTHHSISIFGLVRLVLLKLNLVFGNELRFLLDLWIKCWFYLGLGGLLVSVHLAKKISDHNSWYFYFVLASALGLFTPVSFDHKLLHFIIPCLLFISSKEYTAWSKVYCFLFGFLFIPKAFFYIAEESSIAVFINPLLIFCFIYYFSKENVFSGQDVGNLNHVVSR